MSWRLVCFLFVGVVIFGQQGCHDSFELQESAMQDGFSWVIDEKLAGMPKPGRSFPENEDLLNQDISFLESREISLLVSLTWEPIPSSVLGDAGISSLHLPVMDYSAPELTQQLQFVAAAWAEIEDGGRVGVHCDGGYGRTGTFLATYFVYLGMKPDEAIAEIRRLRPGSIENSVQEQAVVDYYEWLN